MRMEELEKQVESKIAELEELEELEKDRDHYRDELVAAKEAMHKLEARVPRPTSRGTSRTASPAPASPVAEKRTLKQQPDEDNKPNGPARTRSETEELAWLQQQKLNVVKGLEKERARLESELARQTQIAQDALVEAGKMREELTQLQNSKAAASGELELEKQRIEVELGAQAQLAQERARELEKQRDELANMARAISDFERERTRLREELATVVGTTERERAHSNAAIAHMHQRLSSAGGPEIAAPTPLAASAHPASPAMSAAPSIGAPPMSATPSLAGAPTAITGQVRLLVEHLRKTNSELNKEIATLRDENSASRVPSLCVARALTRRTPQLPSWSASLACKIAPWRYVELDSSQPLATRALVCSSAVSKPLTGRVAREGAKSWRWRVMAGQREAAAVTRSRSLGVHDSSERKL